MSETTGDTPHCPLSSSSRYWCHHCGREAPIYMAPDPTCQQCNEQFIEEIDNGGDDPRSFLDGILADVDHDGNEDEDDEDITQFFQSTMGRRRRRQRQQQTNEEGSPTALETILQNALSNLLASGLNDDTANDRSRINNNDNNNNNDGPVYFYRGVVDGNVQLDPIRPPSQTRSSSLGATSRVYFQMGDGGNDDDDDDDVDEWVDEETNGQRGRNNRVNNLQGLLRAIAALAGDSMDLDIVGNPDDYVFSQTALDNIVTQLMEQTGGRTAPPPAPDDVIAALPKRPISEKEFRDQIDCSVCKDDFIVDEMVIELPCMHLFHGDCIDPWLKVNGTCPVCRHSVVPTEEDNNTNDTSPRQQQQQQQQQQQGLPTTEDTWTPPHSTPDSNSRITSNTPASSAASAAFSWITRTSTPPSSWPTSIPGTFSWGPGNTSRYRPQHTESDDESVDMLIDLD